MTPRSDRILAVIVWLVLPALASFVLLDVNLLRRGGSWCVHAASEVTE
jgi:hypothetical protein